MAEQQLSLGLSVILDAVTWTGWLRAQWATLASNHGAVYRPIEVICSDTAEHRVRVERRREHDPLKPTWESVERSRQHWWENWSGDRFVADTMRPHADVLRDVLAYVGLGSGDEGSASIQN